jgi:hypothetical protein
MMIIGCDYHPSWQQTCWLDTATGETGELKLEHASGEAEKFYRGLSGHALIGMESTGNCQWFVEIAIRQDTTFGLGMCSVSRSGAYPSLFPGEPPQILELLERAPAHRDLEDWAEFSLTSFKETAQHAADASREIFTLIEQDRRKIGELGRPAAPVLRVSPAPWCKPNHRDPGDSTR